MNLSVVDGYDDYTTYPEYKAGVYIWKIFPPILLVLGTTGNILSILVLRRKNIQKSVCSIYLIVLSVSDLFVLYTGLLRQWIYVTFGVDIREFGSGICKLHTFSVYFSLDFSSWILIAVTVERVCLVWFPQQTKTKCTKRLTSISLLFVAAFLLLINGHIFFGLNDIINRTNNTTTVTKCSFVSEDYQDFWYNTWPWIDLTIFCGIPFVCLLVGNFVIFMKVFISQRAVKRRIAPSAPVQGARTQIDSKFSSMSIMLFTLNTMFLICNSPVSVYLVGYPSWHKDAVGRDNAILELMWSVVNILMYLNNSINFLLYILSGSRFRREFKCMFQRKQNDTTVRTRHDSIARITTASHLPINVDRNENCNSSM